MERLKINNSKQLNKLIDNILTHKHFSSYVIFKRRDYFNTLLEKIGIDISDFNKKNYFYDGQLHIARSMWDYYLISTNGLAIFKENYDSYKDKLFSSLTSQFQLLKLITEKIDFDKSCEDAFIIDSYIHEELMNFSITFFHNYLFYLELLCKLYISFYENIDMNHKLDLLVNKAKSIMFQNHQNDSLFHYYIIKQVEDMVEYIKTLPSDFKEQFVKYNDNIKDETCIRIDDLHDFYNNINISYEIMDSFYRDNNCYYMKPGLYQKKLDMAKNKEEQKILQSQYDFLITN